MGKLKTAIEFSINLFTTGALFQTSSKVEKEICTQLSDTNHQIVVEFGIGHGNITQSILDHISPTSKLYAFEVNKEFCDHVAKAIPDSRLIIVNKGAEEIGNVIAEPVNNIVSSIPFTFFSKEKSEQILAASYKKLISGGTFSQILYSKLHKKKFRTIFDDVRVKSINKLPPEYIYHNYKS